MSIRLNGTTDAITLGEPAVLDFIPRTDTFSIVLWFKHTGDGFLVYKGTNGTITRQYGMFTGGGNFNIYVGGERTFVGVATEGSGWHHAVLTAPAASSGAKAYVDGVEVIANASIGTTNNTSNVLLGARADGGGIALSLPGELAEIAFYDYVLTQAQVDLLYANGSIVHRTPLTLGPVAYYAGLDGAAGTTLSGADAVRDATIGGNHGTPIGTPTSEAIEMAVLGAGPLIVQAPAVVVAALLLLQANKRGNKALNRLGGKQ